MKYLLITLLLFVSNNSNSLSFDDNEINLEKFYKVKGTFSGDINSEDSFHLIIAKNTKTKEFNVIPAFFKLQDQTLKRLKALSFKTLPSLISFHNKDNVLSLIFSLEKNEEKVIRIFDINVSTEDVSMSEDIYDDDLKATVRRNDRTILVFAKTGELKILNIESSNTIKTIVANRFLGEAKSFVQSISEGRIDVISDNEFIENGSIKNIRLYSTNEKIIITEEIVDTNTTKLLSVPIGEEAKIEIESKSYQTNNQERYKKSTSFVIDNKLYQFKTNKTKGDAIVFDLNTDEQSKIKFKDAYLYKKGSNFKGFDVFFKKASRTNNEPTITLNRTKSNHLMVRFDYVSINNYYHNNDWFFWNQMHWQQQQFFNQQFNANIPQFNGPSPNLYHPMLYDIEEKKGGHFYMIIDSNNNVLTGTKESLVYENIDKDKFVSDVRNNSKYKLSSGIVIGDQYRFFAYSYKSKTFKVYKIMLND